MSCSPLAEWEGRATHLLRDQWEVPALEVYARLGSTNDRAMALAVAGCEAYTVVIADEQTEGRGRRGARWLSARGAGLWMSVVLPGADPAPHVPLLVGLAVAEAIEDVAGGLAIGIEWPNDLVIGDRKLGGILCEGASAAIVAGVGVNFRAPPGGFPEPETRRATSLEAVSREELSRSALAGLIVTSLRVCLGGAVRPPTEDVLGQLARRDALVDRAVVTEECGPGTARGIDPMGALVLERPDGSRVLVRSGSVRLE